MTGPPSRKDGLGDRFPFHPDSSWGALRRRRSRPDRPRSSWRRTIGFAPRAAVARTVWSVVGSPGRTPSGIVRHAADERAKHHPSDIDSPAEGNDLQDIRGHEAVPGSHARASMKASPGPCIPKHLLVAKLAHRVLAKCRLLMESHVALVQAPGSETTSHRDLLVAIRKLPMALVTTYRCPSAEGDPHRAASRHQSPAQRSCARARAAGSHRECGVFRRDRGQPIASPERVVANEPDGGDPGTRGYVRGSTGERWGLPAVGRGCCVGLHRSGVVHVRRGARAVLQAESRSDVRRDHQRRRDHRHHHAAHERFRPLVAGGTIAGSVCDRSARSAGVHRAGPGSCSVLAPRLRRNLANRGRRG